MKSLKIDSEPNSMIEESWELEHNNTLVKKIKQSDIKSTAEVALNPPVLPSFEETIRIMPTQKPGNSRQNYGTPWEFIRVVEDRFGKLVCDLAAEPGNAKCDRYFTKEANSLTQPWAEKYPEHNLWLNPPFGSIAVWAQKCYEESQKRKGFILFLVPASVGSNWFAQYVHNKAMVLALSPRLVFEGEKSSFPKDLMLCVYGAGMKGFDVWRWK